MTLQSIWCGVFCVGLLIVNDKLCANDLNKSERHAFHVESFVGGLGIPWGMAFLPDGRLLVSEREGRLRLVDSEGNLSSPLTNVPPVRAKGQGGLLDVALHPQYETNGWIYLSYTQERGNGDSFTAIARARLNGIALKDVQLVYQGPNEDFSGHTQHYGSRIVFDPEHYLYFSVGDRGQRPEAQLVTTANGKIHRLYDDGRIPEDNPFAGRTDALESIWSYGHRNPQGLAFHPQTGDLWEAEHGPRGGDELNRIVKGQNFGWPAISYGINYNGTIITNKTHEDGMLQPHYYWLPSIGVCAIEFYEGESFPRWRDNLLVASLRFGRLHRLQLEEGRVLHDEILFESGRLRDIETGPDGLIYLALEKPGRIARLVPAN